MHTPPGEAAHGTGPATRRQRLIVAYAIALVLLVAGVSLAGYAHTQRNHTDAALEAADGRLHHTATLLANARAELTSLTAKSAAAGRALSSSSAQLATDQAQLAKAQSDVTSQGVNISNLDTCLSGVERSLNQIALDDESGATATLSGVATSCKNAEPSGP